MVFVIRKVPPKHQTLHYQFHIHIEQARKLFGDGVRRVRKVVKETFVPVFGVHGGIERTVRDLFEI